MGFTMWVTDGDSEQKKRAGREGELVSSRFRGGA